QMERTMASGQTTLLHEVPLTLRNRAIRYISLTCSAVTNLDGQRLGVAAVFKDMTGIRELERRARHADGLALVGTLAAGIAHEVKNPLGGIRGAAQILRQGLAERENGEGTLTECADLVVAQVDRINRLIEELLDLSSPKTLRLGPVNINRVLDDLIRLVRADGGNEAIRFKPTFDPSLPPVRGDAERLTQVFLNLLQNAVEAVRGHAPAGRVRIISEVDLDPHPGRADHSPQPMIAVEIQDDGAGIEPGDLEKLFTPFFTTKSQGSGLGLTVSHKLIADHGGSIRILSTPGKGTRVRVVLPAEDLP
ncbi:MAG: nitrogen regulation protein NR(II), partial [Myxococcota bacterium]